MRHLFCTLVLLFCSTVAEAGLMTGDIAVIGLQDSSDEFSVVLLTDLAMGEEFFFVDASLLGTTRVFGEDLWRFTATSSLSAGTVITIQDGGSVWNQPAEGTLTAVETGPYSDGRSGASLTSSDPLWLFSSTDNAQTIGNSTNLFLLNTFSDVPPGLTETSGVVNRGNGGDIAYNGITTGTASQLFAAISDDSNWISIAPAAGATTGPNVDLNGFTVLADQATVPEPSSWAVMTIAGICLGGYQSRRRKA